MRTTETLRKSKATVEYNADLSAVHITWNGYVSSAEYRAYIEEGLTLFSAKKASYWIADMKEMKIITFEDQKWTIENWTPRALKAGVKSFLMVVSEDIFNQIAVQNMHETLNLGEGKSLFFKTLAEAQQCLRDHRR